jgi:WD40 repeat protein
MMKPVHHAKTSLEAGTYVKDGTMCHNDEWMCFSTTQDALKLYDCRRLTPIRDVPGHNATITDVVANAGTQLLYSSQEDTGVMMTDLRMKEPAHFLTELQGAGKLCFSIDVSPSGDTLAVAAGDDIHLVDTKTWSSRRVLDGVHTDDVTKVRYFGESLLCTGGEDMMINFFDTKRKANDILLSSIHAGECVNKASFVPELSAVCATGTCENAYVMPFPPALAATPKVVPDFPNEVKIPRGGYTEYLIDWVVLGGVLHLVSSMHPDEDDAEVTDTEMPPAAISVRPFDPVSRRVASAEEAMPMEPFHRGTVRVAMAAGGTRLITAGEDGAVAIWDAAGAGGFDAKEGGGKERATGAEHSAGKPY